MKIIDLELHTQNIEPLKQFYTQTLGFEMIDETASSFCLKAGMSKLRFVLNPEKPEGIYHFAFRMPWLEFESITDRLQHKVEFLPEPQSGSPVISHEEWQAKAVYFLDPDGNIGEFIAHKSITETENADDNGVISICEIGFAVPTVPDFANELKQSFGLQRWKSYNEKFEAVGNAHGLFILAEEKRNWFPSSLPAAILPVSVTVDSPLEGSINRFGYSITCKVLNEKVL